MTPYDLMMWSLATLILVVCLSLCVLVIGAVIQGLRKDSKRTETKKLRRF